MPDYSPIDRSSLLMFIFYPRPDASVCPPNGFDLLIPVGQEISLHTRFYIGHQQWPWILFFHGNGEVVSDYDEIAPLFHQKDLNLAVSEYRGYGLSGGAPTLEDLVRDTGFIFEGVKEELSRRRLPPKLWVMGRSLGSISAIELAYRYASDIKGLIIESGFISVARIMEHLGASVENEFTKIDQDCLEMVRKIKTPALVIHGEKDTLVPLREAEALYSHLGSEKKTMLIISSANHNDIMSAGVRKYFGGLREFVTETSL